jgi:hypothetical protein
MEQCNERRIQTLVPSRHGGAALGYSSSVRDASKQVTAAQ